MEKDLELLFFFVRRYFISTIDLTDFSTGVPHSSYNFVSKDETNKHLTKVNVNKSTVDDKSPPKLLQATANVLDEPQTTAIT